METVRSCSKDWAEYEKLHVVNEIWFSPTSTKLPTGATVPDGFMKIIHALQWEKCFFFPNEAPTEAWETYEVPCNPGIRG